MTTTGIAVSAVIHHCLLRIVSGHRRLALEPSKSFGRQLFTKGFSQWKVPNDAGDWFLPRKLCELQGPRD
jgi:hypothetical protein